MKASTSLANNVGGTFDKDVVDDDERPTKRVGWYTWSVWTLNRVTVALEFLGCSYFAAGMTYVVFLWP